MHCARRPRPAFARGATGLRSRQHAAYLCPALGGSGCALGLSLNVLQSLMLQTRLRERSNFNRRVHRGFNMTPGQMWSASICVLSVFKL